MSRRGIAASVALIVVVAFRAFSPSPQGIPAIAVGQGMSVNVVEGRRVFIDRQGSVFTVLDVKSGFGGKPVVWCPYEELFWARETGDIFDRQGRHARGPSKSNMTTYPARLDGNLELIVDVGSPSRPPAGGANVSNEILTFYERFENQTNIPGDRPLVFCPNPVP